MNSESRTVKAEKAKIFEMVLSSPGMSEQCKLVVNVSRQTVLLLARLIEAGLLSNNKNFDDEILTALPENSLPEIRQLHEELLRKSDLTDFYQRLKLF